MQTAASGIKWSATFARESRSKSTEPPMLRRFNVDGLIDGLRTNHVFWLCG
jgi:hypothetical protein